MNANEILEKIEKGEYSIEYIENCGCNFYWHITRDGRLDDDADGNDCWTSNALYVDGELIAEYVRFDGWKVYVDELDIDDLPLEVINTMVMRDYVEQGEIVNDEHNNRARETLIDFLMEGNYELGRDDERGFANEYTMTLKPVASPIEVTREEAEQWADDYLYNGDAVTEAFVGFELLTDDD
jgi:hypothetical protein